VRRGSQAARPDAISEANTSAFRKSAGSAADMVRSASAVTAYSTGT
jgi:hypothetical protein